MVDLVTKQIWIVTIFKENLHDVKLSSKKKKKKKKDELLK